MNQKSLLFIDDEIDSWCMQFYVDELENNGFTVVKCANVDDARSHIESGQFFDAIVIDLIMPPGKWLEDEEANEDLLTGKFIAEKANELKPAALTIFLTNMATPSQFQMLSRTAPVYQKLDTSPRQLVEYIQQYLRKE